MSDKLKTLKDFTRNEDTLIGTKVWDEQTKIVEVEILKEEVIKWIKQDIQDYRIADLHLPAPPVGINIHNFIVEQRHKWKERFNLTQEDLNDKKT